MNNTSHVPRKYFIPFDSLDDGQRKMLNVGCILDSLLTKSISKTPIESIESHVRSRLTDKLCHTSDDPKDCGFCYDMLTNLSANY